MTNVISNEQFQMARRLKDRWAPRSKNTGGCATVTSLAEHRQKRGRAATGKLPPAKPIIAGLLTGPSTPKGAAAGQSQRPGGAPTAADSAQAENTAGALALSVQPVSHYDRAVPARQPEDDGESRLKRAGMACLMPFGALVVIGIVIAMHVFGRDPNKA